MFHRPGADVVYLNYKKKKEAGTRSTRSTRLPAFLFKFSKDISSISSVQYCRNNIYQLLSLYYSHFDSISMLDVLFCRPTCRPCRPCRTTNLSTPRTISLPLIRAGKRDFQSRLPVHESSLCVCLKDNSRVQTVLFDKLADYGRL